MSKHEDDLPEDFYISRHIITGENDWDNDVYISGDWITGEELVVAWGIPAQRLIYHLMSGLPVYTAYTCGSTKFPGERILNSREEIDVIHDVSTNTDLIIFCPAEIEGKIVREFNMFPHLHPKEQGKMLNEALGYLVSVRDANLYNATQKQNLPIITAALLKTIRANNPAGVNTILSKLQEIKGSMTAKGKIRQSTFDKGVVLAKAKELWKDDKTLSNKAMEKKLLDECPEAKPYPRALRDWIRDISPNQNANKKHGKRGKKT